MNRSTHDHRHAWRSKLVRRRWTSTNPRSGAIELFQRPRRWRRAAFCGRRGILGRRGIAGASELQPRDDRRMLGSDAADRRRSCRDVRPAQSWRVRSRSSPSPTTTVGDLVASSIRSDITGKSANLWVRARAIAPCSSASTAKRCHSERSRRNLDNPAACRPRFLAALGMTRCVRHMQLPRGIKQKATRPGLGAPPTLRNISGF